MLTRDTVGPMFPRTKPHIYLRDGAWRVRIANFLTRDSDSLMAVRRHNKAATAFAEAKN